MVWISRSQSKDKSWVGRTVCGEDRTVDDEKGVVGRESEVGGTGSVVDRGRRLNTEWWYLLRRRIESSVFEEPSGI